MQDPIGSFLRIRELYLSYLDTAFRIEDPAVARERRELLRRAGTLCTDPLVEPLPRYETCAYEIHDLVDPGKLGAEDPLAGFDRATRRALVELLLSGLFPSDPRPDSVSGLSRRGKYRLYVHQHDMLRRGLGLGTPGIVTSGTGSGKTESFLLPLFAALSREAKRWPAPGAEYLRRRWWHDDQGKPYERFSAIPKELRPLKRTPLASPFVPHREGETRPAALRAVILYPMNALVEDQLVRLRRALDSREARAAMDKEFHGNRIFFGRYTSAAPVTGHHIHPGLRTLLESDEKDLDDDEKAIRKKELERRQRKLAELFDDMVQFEDAQTQARRFALEKAGESPENEQLTRLAARMDGDDAPFLFPSVDGGEIVSRWDMQAQPPDVLITNVSMLSAMLAREVDAPIFEATKEWLQKEESYFYLVMDELHLQRGSAGTEVAYLLRSLLDRLGLTGEANRHKLRILASSASLPNQPEAASARSAEFLWDMFGRYGLGRGERDRASSLALWRAAIVAGREVRDTGAQPTGRVDPGPFVDLLRRSGGTDAGAAAFADPRTSPDLANSWRAVGQQLLGERAAELNLPDLLRGCIQEAGRRVVTACWAEADGRTRATPLAEVASRLLTDSGADAARGFLFVRGAGDGLAELARRDDAGDFAPLSKLEAPSFRVHTFFRSIEGVYGPAFGQAGVAPDFLQGRRAEIGRLGIERESRSVFDIAGGEENLRLFEVLYCECCGELFLGGMKARLEGNTGYFTELLPHEPNLDGLPDDAASQRFEDLSFEDYGLFWPTDASQWLPGPQNRESSDPGLWRPALLERRSGGVLKADQVDRRNLSPDERARRYVAGFYFSREKTKDRHKRGNDSAGTHSPYSCPKCGTDYYYRQKQYRLSPLRNFRAGFAKTTQLLATELFDAQRVSNESTSPKLVSFSDSRQDAANAAYDIERGHHQDVRRELLVELLRDARGRRRSPAVVEAELKNARDKRTEAENADDEAAEKRWGQEANRLNEERRGLREPSIPLSAVVESPPGADRATYQGRAGNRDALKPLIARFVGEGIHPYDDAGIDRIKGNEKYYNWDQVFIARPEGGYEWKDDPSDPEQGELDEARRNLVKQFHKQLTEVIFSKTYFALEEAGLGYPTVKNADRTQERVDLLSAFLRVLSDAYRNDHNPYDDEQRPPWENAAQALSRPRMRSFALAQWGNDANARAEIQSALDDLEKDGHRNGIIYAASVRVRLAERGDPFWRCNRCGRIHLHLGCRRCTRCFDPLPTEPRGRVEELWERNFLARRIQRSDGIFRLHCEELTGQTEQPARRQREFRGIFVPRWEEDEDAVRDAGDGDGDDLPLKKVERQFTKKEEIDVLAVTTTMEVGIDIGPLQVVLQANMPPQRFNYQQRVGRAGRRGQAYSMALTVCRTRSHDIHYFREPKRITGDVPPTPFLTKRMANIAARFFRKKWLSDVFEVLRREDREAGRIYPGDVMSPPDIHGEFVPLEVLLGEDGTWRKRVLDGLRACRPGAERFLAVLTEGAELGGSVDVDTDLLFGQLIDPSAETRETGLAHTLAERGLLPMYGMPTRVRDLYIGHALRNGRREWRTIDRELELAIYEFAPGAVLVKDKREHKCVGFTPTLMPPPRMPKGRTVTVPTLGGPLSDPFWMLDCATCGSWRRLAQEPSDSDRVDCLACGAVLETARRSRCRVPTAFRTDFRAREGIEDEAGAGRHRSIQAEGRELAFPLASENLRVQFDERSRTYRLNRGPEREGGPRGFEIRRGSQTLKMGAGKAELPEQILGSDDRIDSFNQVTTEGIIWVAAPKTTDALYLAPSAVANGLALRKLRPRTSGPPAQADARWLGIRAAALSAAYLLVNRASLDLDIDPEEFEVLEPRAYGPNKDPLLHITDRLVNGAGFCRYLADVVGGRLRIADTMRSMIDDSDEYPLEPLRAQEPGQPRRHDEVCETACYRCLHRYGNQPFHGLLDWRLGLCYLRCLLDGSFSCGLDGRFEVPGLAGWPDIALRQAREMADRFGGASRMFGALPAFNVPLPGGRGPSPWVLVLHPLWDDAPVEGTLLYDAYLEASEAGQPRTWDTFNLGRRQVQVREWVRNPE